MPKVEKKLRASLSHILICDVACAVAGITGNDYVVTKLLQGAGDSGGAPPQARRQLQPNGVRVVPSYALNYVLQVYI
jgi:hypothetical protein